MPRRRASRAWRFPLWLAALPMQIQTDVPMQEAEASLDAVSKVWASGSDGEPRLAPSDHQGNAEPADAPPHAQPDVQRPVEDPLAWVADGRGQGLGRHRGQRGRQGAPRR